MIVELVGGPLDGHVAEVTTATAYTMANGTCIAQDLPEPYFLIPYKAGLNPRSVVYRLWRHEADGRFLYRHELQGMKS